MYPTFSTPGSFEKEQIFCHGQTSSRVLTMPHFRAAFRGRPASRCQSSHEGARLSQSCPEAAFPLSVPPRPLFRFAMYLSSGFVIRADRGIYSYSFASFVFSIIAQLLCSSVAPMKLECSAPAILCNSSSNHCRIRPSVRESRKTSHLRGSVYSLLPPG